MSPMNIENKVTLPKDIIQTKIDINKQTYIDRWSYRNTITSRSTTKYKTDIEKGFTFSFLSLYREYIYAERSIL